MIGDRRFRERVETKVIPFGPREVWLAHGAATENGEIVPDVEGPLACVAIGVSYQAISFSRETRRTSCQTSGGRTYLRDDPDSAPISPVCDDSPLDFASTKFLLIGERGINYIGEDNGWVAGELVYFSRESALQACRASVEKRKRERAEQGS